MLLPRQRYKRYFHRNKAQVRNISLSNDREGEVKRNATYEKPSLPKNLSISGMFYFYHPILPG